ncbi:MAG: hypothetical protein ACRDBO_08640, partial [Lachnospiraceae bacterium]
MKKKGVRRLSAMILFAAAMMAANSTSVWATAAEAENTPQAKPDPTEFAHITSCAIQGGSQIAIRGNMEGTWSDSSYYDNYLYMFELQPYQDDLTGRTDYCAWITKGDALSFDIALNLGT